MQSVVNELFSVWDYKIETKIVQPRELFNVDEVLITNSLMGTVPGLSMDGKLLPKPSDLWQKINEEVFR
jgi:branched-subunit amino acid aminotransferase/4-amino-4-deoxychorismate lyase